MKNKIKNNIQLFMALCLIVCVMLSSCDSDNAKTLLIIENLSTNEGFFNDEVVIQGTGFSAIPSENLVTFGGVTAEVLSATTTSITAKVPFPAPTGKVTVTTNNEEAPGPIFTIVLPPPTVLAYTSFEEVPTFVGDVTYPKSGTTELENIQLSDPLADDPYVDFTATGNELGFNASFLSSDIGDDGSERMGVFSNENLETAPDDFPARFQDGTQGYITSDLDGTLELVFDEISLDPNNVVAVAIEASIFFGETSYEDGDGINIYYRVNGSLGAPIISYVFEDVIQNEWIAASGTIPVSQVANGNIVVQMKNGANSEMIFLDNVVVKGVNVN